MQTFRSWWWEILCGLLYLALAGGQVAKDPIIGMADNGDFPKVLGRQDVCDSHIYAQYMAPAYKTGPECRWDSHLTSSEAVFLKIVKQIAAWNLEYEIAIQAEGKAHLIVVMAALAVLLWALRESRPPVRFGLPLLIILIFSDVAYVSYLNSFYMDAAAMVFLMLTISLAVAAALRPRAWIAIAFGIAAVLFITSKSQHALLGPLLSALAAWFAFRSARKTALLWTASAIAALLSTVVMVKLTTLEYRTYPLYNIIFFSLAKESPHPEQTLTELGLPPSYLPLVGSHSYAANNPSSSGPWEEQFLARTSYFKLASYYRHHPRIAIHKLSETLRVQAPVIRQGYLGNYRQQDGHPPAALADRFSAWSNLRQRLLRRVPLHALILYLLVAGGCGWCVIRRRMAAEWPLYPIALVLVMGGAIEFVCAALLDCLETARHLFLFHVITEMLIVCAVAALLSWSSRLRWLQHQGRKVWEYEMHRLSVRIVYNPESGGEPRAGQTTKNDGLPYKGRAWHWAGSGVARLGLASGPVFRLQLHVFHLL